jgi:hypothetical protein
MTDQTTAEGAIAGPQWICPAYGAPTATSECSRVAGYYSAAALTVCGAAYPTPRPRAA